MTDDFASWMTRLEQRHLADLQFGEVTRGLRALSSAYVERRGTAIAAHRILDGAGKRAAFALYYGPLHYLATAQVLETLAAEPDRDDGPGPLPVFDLGCGTGAVGAAAAIATGATAITGLDTHPWALDEARDTYAAFGLASTLSRASTARFRPPRRPSLIVAGYVVNELPAEERTRLRGTLVDAVRAGSSLLIVEPLARAASPWWDEWVAAFRPAGADAREWKLTVDPPPLVRKFGDAAGLTATAINVRTLSIAAAGRGRAQPSPDGRADSTT